MTAIGVDVGTTSISVIEISVQSGKVLNTLTRMNNSNLDEYTQDPDIICEIVIDLLGELGLEDAICIGVTCQMHSILYLDESGKGVSPLYTWKNPFGNYMLRDGVTYSEHIASLTGERVPTGYGF